MKINVPFDAIPNVAGKFIKPICTIANLMKMHVNKC
jgi:hypothetical protein